MKRALTAVGLLALVAGGTTAALGTAEPDDGREGQKVVSVSPVQGKPTTTFNVEVQALYRLVDRGDTYNLTVLRGPGGDGCRGQTRREFAFGPQRPADVSSLRFSFGPGRWKVTGNDAKDLIEGRRAPWCPGLYRGTVEFMDFVPSEDPQPNTRGGTYTRRPVGSFAFRVER